MISHSPEKLTTAEGTVKRSLRETLKSSEANLFSRGASLLTYSVFVEGGMELSELGL
jgi:hypothetical protein